MVRRTSERAESDGAHELEHSCLAWMVGQHWWEAERTGESRGVPCWPLGMKNSSIGPRTLCGVEPTRTGARRPGRPRQAPSEKDWPGLERRRTRETGATRPVAAVASKRPSQPCRSSRPLGRIGDVASPNGWSGRSSTTTRFQHLLCSLAIGSRRSLRSGCYCLVPADQP
jgi:hypothetical protein